jgi:hypothetical protein
MRIGPVNGLCYAGDVREFVRPRFWIWFLLLWWFWPSVVFLLSGGQTTG